MNEFSNHINLICLELRTIKFTMEVEHENKLSFLDSIVIRENNKLKS